MGILNLILLKEQTTGNFTDLRGTELLLFDIIDVKKINEKIQKQLLNLYDELKIYEFPSLTEQFTNNFEGRVKLDKSILNILGLKMEEIENMLPSVYEAIAYELNNG